MDDGFEPMRASEWLAVLAETPDDARLRARFDLWLAADPAHAIDWAEMLRTYEVMGMTLPLSRQHWAGFPIRRAPVTLPGMAVPTQPGAGPVRVGPARVGRRRRLLGLGGLAAAAALSLVLLRPALIRITADYATGTAERRVVSLADGTTITLAPETAIDVAYTGEGRRIRLLKGEAFFAVAHDAARPFTVTVGAIRTTDIGTAFDIGRDAEGTEVGVREGMVRVEDPQASPPLSRHLASGQWVHVAPDGETRQGMEDAGDVDVWLQGQFVARNQPVGSVVARIRRYYPGLILLRGEGLAAQTITGVFNVADPLDALKAVAQSQGARLRRPLPWVAILSTR